MAATDDRPQTAGDSTGAKLKRLAELRAEALHAGSEQAVEPIQLDVARFVRALDEDGHV